MMNSSILSTRQVSPDSREKKHIKITAINYQRNCDSDFTERIKLLDKGFDYDLNSRHFWGDPELSLLYGTPLYQQASNAQKRALSHLYWATQYNQTAATEANAVLYNQVTAGVFTAFQDYGSLCQELDLETAQERDHIHAFHNIGYKTKKALLGKAAFSAPARSPKSNIGPKHLPKRRSPFTFRWQSSPLSGFQAYILRFATNRVLLRQQSHCYSQYLQQLDSQGEAIPAQTTGLLGQLAPRPFLQFLTLSCGSSPFMACVFYATRFMANMLIKNYEYRYSKYCRGLEKQGEFIPDPIAVSHLHLLDEAFHTTTSQLIAQDFYRDFPQPSAYEKFLANLVIYRAQVVGFSGLSGTMPAIFRGDATFLPSLDRLLQSPVFSMSSEASRHWLRQCLCHEHDGFHLTLKYHQRLLNDLRRFYEPMDYLWPVNRDLRVMAAGGSIERAIAANTKAFESFAQSVA